MNLHGHTQQTRPASFEATRLGRALLAAVVLTLAGCGSVAGAHSGTTTSPAGPSTTAGSATTTVVTDASPTSAPADTTPATEATTAPPAGDSCSPHPCGSNGGLAIHVTGLVHVPTAPGLVEATFTVTNNDTQGHDLNGALDTYQLQPGNEPAITDLDASSLGYLADGSACQSDQASLPPGTTSPTLHTCFTLTDSQIAEPLKFIWTITNDGYSSAGTIDLAGLPMQ